MSEPGLRISWEWEPTPSIRLPEHRATWARIEMAIGDDFISLVEDKESSSSRRSIYCPLYPLAEWIAFNWWLLQADTRQAGRRWGLIDPRHRMRSAGDGFLWPDLAILPEGGQTRLVWRRDRQLRSEDPIRFLSEGECTTPSRETTRVLTSVVEGVLSRLRDVDVQDTALAKEWSAIQETDQDEREFCLAAASLGLDPYSEAEPFEHLIMRANEELNRAILDDFFHAATPSLMSYSFDWINRAEQRAMKIESAAGKSELVAVGRSITSDLTTLADRPWETGWATARQLRDRLGVASSTRFEPADYLYVLNQREVDRQLHAFGRSVGDREPVVVLGREQVATSRRFTLSRSLWHALGPSREFLVTEGNTDRQKAERAFAAELLAPAAGIAEQLGASMHDAPLTDSDIERVAGHFGVGPMLISHQVENQLLAS